MELVISYHAEQFHEHKHFPSIISSLIRAYYPENSKLELTLKDNTLEIWAPKLSHMTSPTTTLSLLRYLKFKDLFIADNSIRYATEFAGLNLRKLHLQHTQIRDLSPLLKISTLDHVTVQQGQIPNKQLTAFSKHFSKELVQVYEAEKADLKQSAIVMYDHKHYTSSGFVAGFNKDNSAKITFKLNAKKNQQEKLSLRYSAGTGDAKIVIILNGIESYFTLPSTRSWEQWKSFEVPVNLIKGQNILSIKMKHSNLKCFNLDSVSRQIKY